MTRLLLLLALLSGGAPAAAAGEPSADETKAAAAEPATRPLDRSGKKRKGEASYYSRKFTGKPMADGTPMRPESNAAASKTLPLGTRARVKNLDSGKSAEVEIRDRGPYVPGRIIDVTPQTAEQLDMKEAGVAPVEVTPLELPPPGD
jgi:rare lipoprotein A